MLETMLDRHIIFVFMGILTAVGIMSKCIANVALKRLIRAAGNMNKSTHPLMRLVRAKFEHVSMISDKVENVSVFVDKYLYEYKVLGVRLHSWRRMEKTAAGLCLLAGAAGAWIEYSVNGMSSTVWKTGAVGGGLAAIVFLIHLTTDEKYQMEAVRNYMVDYLENVCRHKYEKTNQKEIKILAQEGTAADFTSMPADDQENIPEYAGKAYGGKSQETAGKIYENRTQEEAEPLFAAKTREPDEEVYATRKREPMKGQSAVSAFLAAELKAEEAEREEEQDTYRAVKTGTGKSAEIYHSAELEAGEVASAFRVAESAPEENIVELPKPEKVREPVREALAAAVSDSGDYAGQTRSAVQRPAMAKEKKPRRERPAEEADRDVVIRRILEEFMA